MSSQALVEGIVDQLRRDILRGVLKPGCALKERDKATEMGVSRTPLREALRILAKEGLITLRHARSPLVSQLDVKSVTDQTEVLITLEKLSAQLTCRNATTKEITAIEEIAANMAKTFNKIDAIDTFEKDMKFHSAIAFASHNQHLAESHKLYLQRLWYPRYLAASNRRDLDRVVCEHAKIVSALKMRDETLAQEAVETHLINLTDDMALQVKLLSERSPKTHKVKETK